MTTSASENEQFIRDEDYTFKPSVTTEAIPQEGKMAYVTETFSHATCLGEEDGHITFLGVPDGKKKWYFFRVEREEIDKGTIVVTPATR